MVTKDKYDRQLRLWGSSGQKALYESIVVLVNASACGTETLKNLVLPGIGSFHIVDDQIITNTPRSNVSNFFLCPAEADSHSSTGGGGKSRAEVATVYLSELNSDVYGRYTHCPSLMNIDFHQLLSHIYQEHSTYDRTSNTNKKMFVIAADLPPTILLKLSSACWNYGSSIASSIPLCVARSYGLVGTVRLQVRYHPIIESKPDHSVPDLRVVNTRDSSLFPPLRSMADKIRFHDLDYQEHSHIPYVIILIKALDQWILQNGSSSLPKTMQDKEYFRSIIQSLSRDFSKEMNFQEAYENSYLGYTIPELPFEVSSLIQSLVESYETSASFTSSFDILLFALHRFMNQSSSSQYPIQGSIPDMTSSTQHYIELQQIYRLKAEEDKALMKSIVHEIMQQMDPMQRTDPSLEVTEEDISLFCKNISNLRLIHTRSIYDEYHGIYHSNDEKEELLGNLLASCSDPYDDTNQTPLVWYILLRACDLFYQQFGTFPGHHYDGIELENEIKWLEKATIQIIDMLNLNENEFVLSTLLSKDGHDYVRVNTDFLREIIRFDNAEIHSVASLIGGIASQEVVKLITKQFVPIDGTYVFNGIASVADVYKV